MRRGLTEDNLLINTASLWNPFKISTTVARRAGGGRRYTFPTWSNLPIWHPLRWLDGEEKAKRTWGACSCREWPSGPLLVPVVWATLLPSLGERSPLLLVAGKVWRGHLPPHLGCPEFGANSLKFPDLSCYRPGVR